MTHSMLLLPNLEAIEPVMNEKYQTNLKAKVKEESSASNSTALSGNPNEQVLKKARPAKFCQHCKNKGAPQLTHNTNKCCKYDKDSNPMAAATYKPSEARKPFKKGGDKQIAYLIAIIESIVKTRRLQSLRSISVALMT